MTTARRRLTGWLLVALVVLTTAATFCAMAVRALEEAPADERICWDALTFDDLEGDCP